MDIKKIAITLISILVLLGCEEVADLLNPGQPPILDKNGIKLSRERVLPRDTVYASIFAENPEEGPLTFEWTASGGLFVQPSDKDTVGWVAPLLGGTYQVQVKVSNSEKDAQAQRNIFVSSLEKPLVDIIEPIADSYFNLNQKVAIRSSAYHQNGLRWVRLRIKTAELDSILQTLGFNPENEYLFEFDTFENLVGKTTIMVEAEAANGLNVQGNDSVIINVEGSIVGKSNQ